MKNLIILSAIAVLFSSCLKQKEEPKTPEFEVSTTKASYKLGESTIFNFTGNPDYITFYSGEQGANYVNKDRYTATGIPKLQFTSARNAGAQANSLKVMVSSNFAGLGADSATTAANINAATWTDITAKATLATTATAVASGAIDLSEFLAGDKPIYIAFKYNATTGSIQNKWTITGLTVTNTLPDATVYTIANLSAAAITNYSVATLFSPGWVPYKYIGPYNWVVTAGSSLVITGAATAAAATTSSETWTFTGPVTLNRVTNDVGTAIKESSLRINTSNYTFKSAGTFNVNFVATNANVFGRQEVVKQVQVTITP
jgi:hypothetical protein